MGVLLKADRLRVCFGSLVAVRDVSLELEGGQLLGLVGPNGAGKTTLLRALTGLQAPTSGSASIMGYPVLGENEVVRREIGFAPDSPPAYEEITLVNFLRFIGRAYHLETPEIEERIDFWLERLWLEDRRNSRIGRLSKGMRQRVTLARTFLPNPHVLLLDEPLAGLDPAGRVQLRGVLASLRDQGCVMIVSSHILTDLEEVSTHIAILEHGSILRYGPTHALHDGDGHAHCRYRLAVVGDLRPALNDLGAMEGVDELSVDGTALEFDYDADPESAAALLSTLIERGVRVSAFHPMRSGLEEAYLQAGLRQVD